MTLFALLVRLAFDNGADKRSIKCVEESPATLPETFNFAKGFLSLESPRAGLELDLEGVLLPFRRLVRGATAPVSMDMKLSWSIASAAAVASEEAPLAAAKRAFTSNSFLLRRSRRFLDLVSVSTSAE